MKPFFQSAKKPSLALCCLALAAGALAVSCGRSTAAVSAVRPEHGYTPQKDESGNYIADANVSIVRFTAPLKGYGFVGDAAEAFFDSVKWNGFDTDGGESFADAAGKKGTDEYLLQFKVHSFNSIEFYALEINGKPQGESKKQKLLDSMFGKK